jgi:hypothetical protein
MAWACMAVCFLPATPKMRQHIINAAHQPDSQQLNQNGTLEEQNWETTKIKQTKVILTRHNEIAHALF